MADGDVHRVGHHAGLDLARVADVDDLDVGDLSMALVEGPRCQARGLANPIGMLNENPGGVADRANDAVESDTREPVLRLQLVTVVDKEHDVGIARDDRSSELGVATAKADVDGALEVAESELLGGAAVDEQGASGDGPVGLLKRQGSGQSVLIEQFPLALVEHRVVDEIAGSRRLTGGHHLHEGIAARSAKGVVRRFLVADRGGELSREVLPAGRSSPVGGEHPGDIRKGHQLVVKRLVELLGQFVLGEADRGEKVGTPDVADEERVTGQHAVGLAVVGVLEDNHAHRFGGVSGGVAELEGDVSERHPLTVGHLAMIEFGVRHRRVADLRAGCCGKFEVSGEEVSVEVGFDDHLDGEATRLRVGEVLGDVPLGVDDNRAARGLIADEVRGVGEAFEVVLLELHRNSFVVCL